jgi:septal ring factor EnvC (AmiA/AmiB activator)
METDGQRIARLENEVADLKQSMILHSRSLDKYRVHNQVLRDRMADLENDLREAVRILAEQAHIPGVDFDLPKWVLDHGSSKQP